MEPKPKTLVEYEATITAEVLKIVSAKAQEYNYKHKPYCERCAKETIKSRMIAEARMQEARQGFIDFKELKLKVEDFIEQLDQFGDEKKFIVISTKDAWNRARGETKETIYAKTIDYKCIECDAGISVDVPLEELNKKK